MNIPSTLGGFQISERLGAGAMGTVYRAVQSSLGRVVVVKTLHPHLAADLDLIARFEREARHAAHLQHQNTVQVIEFGREGEVHYIAMEYVEGMDLKQILQLRGPFPIPIAILVLRDVCRGLEAAHARDIIHRDIKPANLMITANGVIKVMDFGLARETAESSTLTAAGSVMGSPAYMSPEQARGASVDQLTDVFSTGLVGYEILSGARAFTGESYPLVLHRVLNEEIPPLASLRPDIPGDLLQLIESMTRKDAAQRCPSISEARDQLEALVKQLSLKREDAILGEFVRAAIVERELRDPRPNISEAKSTARTVISTSPGAPEGTVVADPARTRAARSGAAVAAAGNGSAMADREALIDGVGPAEAAGTARRTTDPGVPGSLDTADSAEWGASPGKSDSSGRSASSGSSDSAARRGRRLLALAPLGAVLLLAVGWLFLRSDPSTPDSAEDPSRGTRTTDGDLAESAGNETDRQRANLERDATERQGANLGGDDIERERADVDGENRDDSDPDSQEGVASYPPASGSDPGTSTADAALTSSSEAGERRPTQTESEQRRTEGSRTAQEQRDTAADPARNLGRDSDDTQEEPARTERPASPFEKEYSVSTFPGFAFIRVDGKLINEDGSIPVRTVLREGAHTFQLTRSNGEDLGTLQYSVARDDPNRVLILKFEDQIVEARVK